MPPFTTETTILLVDADEPARLEIVRTLSTLGYRVFAYANGEAAVAFVRGHAGPIALLVTVSMCTGMNDIEAAAAIRLMRPRLPVLHMCGRSRESVVAAADSTIALALSP